MISVPPDAQNGADVDLTTALLGYQATLTPTAAPAADAAPAPEAPAPQPAPPPEGVPDSGAPTSPAAPPVAAPAPPAAPAPDVPPDLAQAQTYLTERTQGVQTAYSEIDAALAQLARDDAIRLEQATQWGGPGAREQAQAQIAGEQAARQQEAALMRKALQVEHARLGVEAEKLQARAMIQQFRQAAEPIARLTEESKRHDKAKAALGDAYDRGALQKWLDKADIPQAQEWLTEAYIEFAGQQRNLRRAASGTDHVAGAAAPGGRGNTSPKEDFEQYFTEYFRSA